MRKFKGKYDAIFEDTIYRFQSGGLMTGDIVKFKDGALKNEKLLGVTEQMRATIQNAMETDLNLRVGAVKSIYPNTTQNYGGYGTDAPDGHFVDIVVEYAPGMWRDPITVPLEVLERVDTGINMAPIPDSLKKETDVHKPVEIVGGGPNHSNAKKNTVLPSVAPKDGRSGLPTPQAYVRKESADPIADAYDLICEAAQFNKYYLTFSKEYGAEPRDRGETRDLIGNLLGLFGHNTQFNWKDDNTLELTIQKEANPKQIQNAVAPLIDGTIEVKGEMDMQPEMGIAIGPGNDSMGAEADYRIDTGAMGDR